MSSSKTSSFVGLRMYTPAIIALIGYIVMALVILMPFEIPVYDESNDKVYIVKYDLAQRLVSLLLLSIPFALSVYTINCLMAGQCLVWSYVMSIMTLLWIALFVIGAFAYTFRKK
jgi:hypothetical protein